MFAKILRCGLLRFVPERRFATGLGFALLVAAFVGGCSFESPTLTESTDHLKQPQTDQHQSIESGAVESGSIYDYLRDREAVEFCNKFRAALDLGGQFSGADFQQLRQLVTNYPQVDDLWDLLAQAIMVRRDWESLIDHHLSRPPEKRDQDQLAVAYLRSSRFEEALEHLEKTIAESGSSNERQWMLAVANYQSGHGAEASRILEPLIPQAKGPHLAELWHLHAQLAHQRGDWDEAESSYKSALDIMPDQIGWLVRYGQILRLLGRDDLATETENRSRELQWEADRQESTQRLLAALANSLTLAWDQQDFDACLKIITQMEPHADPQLQQFLDGYRREITRLRKD